uniref:Truncated non-structural protein 3c n=1 Tax=Feline coronavirus TaxID=12663 RepID=A0A2Z6FAC9_9ALPC|nr:truncated non-structural protein 3c [Feline coronavirus]
MIGVLFLNTLSFIVSSQHVANNTPHVNTIVQQHHVVSTNIKSFHLEFSIAVLFFIIFFYF